MFNVHVHQGKKYIWIIQVLGKRTEDNKNHSDRADFRHLSDFLIYSNRMAQICFHLLASVFSVFILGIDEIIETNYYLAELLSKQMSKSILDDFIYDGYLDSHKFLSDRTVAVE